MVKNSVDPITLEVVQNALSSIADELALVIMRAAYSNIVRDSMDYSTAVCDFSGKTIAQGLTNPVHLGSFPHAMKNLVFQQKANMNEGDIFIFNDPYGSGGMHLPDFYIIKPIFINDSIEGYTATLAHQTDVGGIAPGGMGVFSKEIYQEGLRLPILKLYERNKPNKAILDIIQKNKAFDYLDAPIERISAIDAPQIYSMPIEKIQLPNPERIIKIILKKF